MYTDIQLAAIGRIAREETANDILTAMESLICHVAYCRDPLYDRECPCTMPHAHRISHARAMHMYNVLGTWADAFVLQDQEN